MSALLLEHGFNGVGFSLLASSASAGVPEAQYRVGCCYLHGAIVPISHQDAILWLTRSAEQAHYEAQAVLAALLFQGLGGGLANSETTWLPRSEHVGAPDFSLTLRWAQTAAENGSALGQAVLGYVLLLGPPEVRDRYKARRWLRAAAEGGCAQGTLGYALSLWSEARARGNYGEVIPWLRRAGEAGLPTALYLLGVVMEQGLGVTADIRQATDFYHRAAQRGHPIAQFRWGSALMVGRVVERDVLHGESWLRAAALAGCGEAAAAVAHLYIDTAEQDPNYAEAVTWLRRAVDAGYRPALRSLRRIERELNGSTLCGHISAGKAHTTCLIVGYHAVTIEASITWEGPVVNVQPGDASA